MLHDCKPRGAKASHWFTPGSMSCPNSCWQCKAVGNHLYTTDVGALRMGFDLELMLMMLQLAKSFLEEAELGMEAHSAEKLLDV
jgi:hypothetical protein